MELIVRHRTEKILHSGICIKQEIVQTEAPANSLDITGKKIIVPTCLCFVAWNQQIVSDEGDISYPADNQRVPAVCLHYASELIFEGIYNKEDEQDNEADEEYKLVGEYLEEHQPEIFEQILKTVTEDTEEAPTEEENEGEEGEEVELVDQEEQKVETV